MGFLAQELRSSIKSGGSLSSYSDFWYNSIGGGPTKAGVPINEETAIKYLAVFSCVSLISGDLASLPLILYKTGKDGSKKRATDEPLYDIMHNQPNRNTDSMHWRETGESHLLTWGNFYSDVKRDYRTGEIKEIIQIPKPGGVKLKKNRKSINYIWIDQETGKKQVRLKKDMLHIAGFGFNGLTGMSVIGIAREAIALGVAARDYGSLFFGQGINSSGVFSTDKNLGDNRKEFVKDLQSQYAGLGKSHKAMVLEGGMKYDPITIPMDDAQFLATRKHQDLDICGMYKVPPHKIAIHGANSNNNNLEQENGSYVSQCLRPWLVRWEQAMNMQLLTPDQRKRGLFFEILAEGLLRGDQAARSEYYKSMWSQGAMSANDINKIENRNPVPGGDQYFVPLNFIPSDMATDLATQNNEPVPKQEAKTFRSLSGSIILRDRIAKQYYPLFKRAAQDIVNKEGLAVKAQVNKQRKLREDRDMQSWLDDFYRKMPDEIKSKIGPVIRSFSEAIQAASADEMGIEVGISDDLERFINDYTERYAERHTQSSLGQLTSLLEQDLEALEVRVDEWAETRADKIASNETVRTSNAVYQAVAFSIGLSTVWRIRGSKTCPYCTSLNGKRVSSGQTFVNDGDELNPDGAEVPMKIRGMKAHPPLHQKCLPGYANVTAFGITASSEDWFDGNLIVIYTASGNKITCTPDHPVLTSHGWVNADKINIGNQVRKTVTSNWDTAIIGDSKNVKALIKDVSKSFIDTSKMIAVPVPTSSKDFKGNIFDSKITIIRTDGSLLLERDPGLFHELRKFNLNIGDSGKIPFTSDSSFTEFIKARFPSQCRGMSGRDLLLSLGSGHGLPIDQPGFSLPTNVDPMNGKIFINNHSGNSKTIGNGKDGFPVEILSDEVVRIENNAFHGLVYNLHTKDNLFYTESLVVHNCDCYLGI